MNTDLSLGFLIILALALFLLFYGIWLYRQLIKRSNPKLFYSSVIISWVLISLFPVVLLFSVFQNSSLTGEFKDTSFGTIAIGGAFGAFFVIWFMGTRNTLKAIKEDHSEEKVTKLTDENRNLREQIVELKGKPLNTRSIPENRKLEFIHDKSERILGLITGDIQQVRDIDLWVNSENTNLQMGRFYDPSISGLIRYLGAEKDKEGNVIDDIVADALMKCRAESTPENGGQKGDFPAVKPGLAYWTTSGKLKETHNVQGIIHVATVFGEIGQGYTPLKNMGACVHNALAKADEFAVDMDKNKLSIVFPLFGTGTAKGNLDLVVQDLFYATLSYFESHPNSRVNRVYFLAWKEYERDTCLHVLNGIEALNPKDPS